MIAEADGGDHSLQATGELIANSVSLQAKGRTEFVRFGGKREGIRGEWVSERSVRMDLSSEGFRLVVW